MSATAAALVLPSAPAVQHAAALAARRHRQRKHRGEAIRHKRTVAELQALEAKPLHERTEEEKEAVRGFRKRRNGRAAPALEPRALTSPSSAAPAVPVLSAASPVSASSLAASAASAGAPVVVAAAAAASSPLLRLQPLPLPRLTVVLYRARSPSHRPVHLCRRRQWQ